MKQDNNLKDNISPDIVESPGMFNKWSELESSDGSRIVATSQFFYPLDIRVYIDLIRKKPHLS